MKQILLLPLWMVILIVVPQYAGAQWSVGAGYELREQDPPNGFGLRLQRDFLNFIPITRLGIRGYISYFPEQNTIEPAGNGTDEWNLARISYNAGVALTGGVNMGLTRPYAGVGLAVDHFETRTIPQSGSEGQSVTVSEQEENVTWNAIAGAEISLLPSLHPFIEYKFSQFVGPHRLEYNHTGSLSFGLMLKF